MSKRWRGITAASPTSINDSQARFQTRSGHICVLCGFIPTTKNKYRELQDHLVRVHFREDIKAALPTRRPYLCPEKNCNVEGKDWQALMRHYTGKHGVLDAYLKEALSNPHNNNNNIEQIAQEHHLPVVEASAMEHHETLYIQDPNNVIHQEVSTMDPCQDQQSVEVVTSFELPTMMTTTLDATATTITTTESCLHQSQAQYVTHHELAEAQNHPSAGTIQLQNFQEVISSPEVQCGDDRLKDSKVLEVSSPNGGACTTTVLNNEELAAQVNTVSSTIPFPTTIPLMLGATATKRPKTEPDIVVNNGETPENYELVDLKYFIADPSKVLSLPYKIILPQMEEEEEMKSFESRVVQTEPLPSPPLTVSVQVQTDPWYPPSPNLLRHNTHTEESATQTPSIKPEPMDTSSSHPSRRDSVVSVHDNSSSGGGDSMKELDFSMF
uniref:C2H2-type domain-containing protein n=1 Tax=Lepeophtheirus salmonis TaxID=72036 RepID=A0A0K2T3Y6_LEPSM